MGSRHSAHLTPDTVMASEQKVWVVLPLDTKELAVILLSPEPPLPLAGVQGILGLIEVGGDAVPVNNTIRCDILYFY